VCLLTLTGRVAPLGDGRWYDLHKAARPECGSREVALWLFAKRAEAERLGRRLMALTKRMTGAGDSCALLQSKLR
jgi:hypothetical protein